MRSTPQARLVRSHDTKRAHVLAATPAQQRCSLRAARGPRSSAILCGTKGLWGLPWGVPWFLGGRHSLRRAGRGECSWLAEAGMPAETRDGTASRASPKTGKLKRSWNSPPAATAPRSRARRGARREGRDPSNVRRSRLSLMVGRWPWPYVSGVGRGSLANAIRPLRWRWGPYPSGP